MHSRARTLINPPGTEKFYNTWHFSQGIRVGKTVWTSGQVGIDEEGKAGATIEDQTRQAFRNLERVLAEGGCTLGDIVELTSYHIAMGDLAKVGAVKDEFISQDFPAWTAVGVTQLVLPEMLIEIKATAVIDSKR